MVHEEPKEYKHRFADGLEVVIAWHEKTGMLKVHDAGETWTIPRHRAKDYASLARKIAGFLERLSGGQEVLEGANESR